MKRPVVTSVVFLDIILNALLGFVVLFLIANVQKKNVEQKKAVPTEGAYAITATWPPDSANDVDLYIRDPSGAIVFFKNREAGLMHLEHDDLGEANDLDSHQSAPVRIAYNGERIIIRGVIPGEYTVNIHLYSQTVKEDTPVTVVLYRLLGAEPLHEANYTLTYDGEEHTLFRFSVNASGAILEYNELPAHFVGEEGAR